MKVTLRILYVFIIIAILTGCNSTKYVADGQYLLDKNIIHSDNKDFKSSELKSYVRQQPNFKAFGVTKWQLYVYNWSGRNEDKWVNKQLRRIGEAPVLLDTTLVEQSVQELERFFVNKGYIHAEVTATIDTTSRKKKATVIYDIESNEPYRIRDYEINLSDPRMDSIAHLQPPPRPRFRSPFRSTSDEYTSLVKEGNLFDRDVLDKERQRVTSLLRRRGYYAFTRENLRYQADSAYMQNIVDLEMLQTPFRRLLPDGTIQEEEHKQYYINSVTFMTDYDPLRLNGEPFILTDSVQNGNITVLYGINGRSIRPGVFRKSNYIRPGALYNERAVEQTYSSLASLRALRSVNIRFNEIEENDTTKLDCVIITSPAKRHGFGIDLEGTNSSGDLGFASSINYQHRNLFKGSEVLSTRIRGAYESLSNAGYQNYWEIGGEVSLNIPRFVFPFLKESFRRRSRATTEFRTSYNRQNRPEYKRDILSGGWSYIWQDRTNTLARHTFKLIDVNYLHLRDVEEKFYNNLPTTTRLYNFNDQFILSTGYSYSFNNYNPQYRQRNTHSFRVAVELAGNSLYAISKLTGAEKEKTEGENEGKVSRTYYTLFGTEYAQYAKGDFDFSKGIVLDTRNRIAFHIGVGLIYPYGNGYKVPFERRYFSGGANSVRGWSVRSLGPGSMTRPNSYSFATQVGDIRLDANLEYRTNLFWKFELAGYVDAGNIWTIKKYEDQPKGDFDFSRFYKEIAFSYGVGLRLDFDFFLIRFDTGFKAYNPQENASKKWAIKNPNFTNNFAWHFAVGYPF